MRGKGNQIVGTQTTYDNHAVAVYATHDEAEAAVKMLSKEGFDMKKLSLVGQNYETDQHPVGFVNAGDRMLTWGKFGAFWGSIWGLLFGSAMVMIPGAGIVFFAGWIVSMVEGAVLGGGLAALGGALASVGIPNDTVVKYETAIKAGSFLLIAHGTQDDVQRAKELLASTNATQLDVHSTEAVPVS
jgi:uncharacterized membrane protein